MELYDLDFVGEAADQDYLGVYIGSLVGARVVDEVG